MRQTALGFSYAATHGAESSRPVAHGDVLVTSTFGAVVVTHADSDAHGRGVYVAVRLDNGRECVALEREVLYRRVGSRRAA